MRSGIIERINNELVNNPQIDASNIWVNFEDGNVTLAGSVPEPKTLVLAEEAVTNIEGVREVVSLLSVDSEAYDIHVSDPPASPKDKTAELKLQIEDMTSEGGIH